MIVARHNDERGQRCPDAKRSIQSGRPLVDSEPCREPPSDLDTARKRAALRGVDGVRDTLQLGSHVSTSGRVVIMGVDDLRDMISDVVREHVQPLIDAGDQVLTREQVGTLLQVCSKTVTEYVERMSLPTSRMGKEYRFLRSEVIAWLKKRGPSRSMETSNRPSGRR